MDLAAFVKETGAQQLAESLADRLYSYIAKQRWFGGKAREVRGFSIQEALAHAAGETALLVVLCRFVYADGLEYYQVPLLLAWWDRVDVTIEEALASIELNGRELLVLDALSLASGRAQLVKLLAGTVESDRIRPLVTSAGREVLGKIDPNESRLLSLEQSNSSVLYEGEGGHRAFLKLYRRVEPGPSPELELGQYLTEQVHFGNTPRTLGALEYEPTSGCAPWTLALAQEFVENKGDAWTWFLATIREELSSAKASVPPCSLPHRWRELLRWPVEPEFCDRHKQSLRAAGELGRCTALLHRALAAAQEPESLRPVPTDAAFLERLLQRIDRQQQQALAYLTPAMELMSEDLRATAARVRDGLPMLVGKLRDLLRGLSPGSVNRIRVHGDYHLGQVLVTPDNSFVIIDFEGEPARSLEERREKELAFKDVAGMLRSFDYAAHSVAAELPWPSETHRVIWARSWSRAAMACFLQNYDELGRDSRVIPVEDAAYEALLTAYYIEKAMYELLYELNNRPAWVSIPLAGVASLLEE